MARGCNLDVKTVESLKPRARPYCVYDGGGLMLRVMPTGAKVWIVRTMVLGRRRDVGVGGYPLVSLAEARERARDVIRQARAGLDPVEEKRRERERLKAEAERRRAERLAAREHTFAKVAERYIATRSVGWRNPRTLAVWRGGLAAWVFPHVGNKPVAEITRADAVRALSRVWVERPALARKLMQATNATMRYASAVGLRGTWEPVTPRDAEAAGLPPLPAERPHPALPWRRLPAFWRALTADARIEAICLRLIVLTALRSKECREARWSWVAFDDPTVPVLVVPAEHRKRKARDAAEPHRVPLPPQAVAVLCEAARAAYGLECAPETLAKQAALFGDALIFPNATRTGPIPDYAVSRVVREMNAPRVRWTDETGAPIHVHGARATFSSWVDDVTPNERETAERALAHKVADRASRAYRRSDAFERRVWLMRAWADFVTEGRLPVEVEEMQRALR